MLRKLIVTSLLLLPAAFIPPGLHAQDCGGTERWQVKVGTDTGVDSVDLQTVTPKSLQELLMLQHSAPLPPRSDNDTRLDEEIHVYQVKGHLVQWKQEAGAKGDSDYHLVITDDTRQFTGDAQNDGPGNSVIAEIPDPNCIAGKRGDPDVASKFIAQITCARGKMDVKFPDADRTGNWNVLSTDFPVVTVTGVGFFDRAHGQTGRATNDLEIHPILDIDLGDGQASCFPASGGAAVPAVHPGGAAVLAAHPAGPKPKWDYKSITAATPDALAAQADQQSAQGWELVGVAFDSKKNAYVGFLKRAFRP